MSWSLTVTYLEAVARLNRRTALAESERDVAWELVASLRTDLADAQEQADRWRAASEVLYLIADESKRDGVLSVLDTIERLEVAGEQ